MPILSKPLNIRQWLPQRNDSQSCVQRIPDDGTGVCEGSSAEHRSSPKDQSPCIGPESVCQYSIVNQV